MDVLMMSWHIDSGVLVSRWFIKENKEFKC